MVKLVQMAQNQRIQKFLQRFVVSTTNNDQDDDDEDSATPTRPNTEEINQEIEILTKFSLYCENGQNIQAAVQICSILAFRDIIISKKQRTT